MYKEIIMTKRVMLMWAGGKESALAYKKIVDGGDVVDSICTLTDQGQGVYNSLFSGVRTQRNYIPITLIEKQAEVLGVPLVQIAINDIQSLSQYYDSLVEWSEKCIDVYAQFAQQGGTHVAFGYHTSMCLETKNVQAAGLECLYPLLNMGEQQIVDALLSDQYKSVIVRTNNSVYGTSAGRHHECGEQWDETVCAAAIAANASQIGEDGTFGTFCYDGPIFSQPIDVTVLREVEVNVDDFLTTAKVSDLNAFNVLQFGATRSFADLALA